MKDSERPRSDERLRLHPNSILHSVRLKLPAQINDSVRPTRRTPLSTGGLIQTASPRGVHCCTRCVQTRFALAILGEPRRQVAPEQPCQAEAERTTPEYTCRHACGGSGVVEGGGGPWRHIVCGRRWICVEKQDTKVFDHTRSVGMNIGSV